MFRQIRPYSASLALGLGIFALAVTPSQVHSLSIPANFYSSDESSLLLAQQQQPRTALIIANYDYGGDDDLVGPRQDAADMYEKLKSLGFEVPLPVTNATKQQMEQAIRDFAQRMRPGGANVFYYSGHGVQIGGTNYLLPTGLASTSSEVDVAYNAVRLDYVVNMMHGITHDFNFLIIDACRNNPLIRRWNRPKGPGSQGLGLIAPPSGTMIAYAAEPGEVAQDGDDNSPFTASLLNYLDSQDITIYNMLHRIQRDVLVRTDQDQRPVWEGSPNDYSFTFNPGIINIETENPPGPGSQDTGTVLRVGSWSTSFHEPEYKVENFTQSSDALEFKVSRGGNITQSSIAWGIQIYSSNPVNLESGRRYKLQFQVSASQPFELVARLGERDYRRSIFIDRVFNVGGVDPVTFEVEFTAENFAQNSHLYFQTGDAPDGTQIEIRNVQFLEVAD